MIHKLVKDPGLPVPNPTKSYWQTPGNERLLNIQSLHLHEKRDVVILGSGITGCSVSHWLLKGSDSLTISLMDAREICSGATGRNGGRINAPAIQNYAKYRQIFGHHTAVAIVKFELAHFDALRSVVDEIGPALVHTSEIRQVSAIATAFSQQKVEELRQMLVDFEQALPEYKGVWRIADEEEIVQKYNIKNAKGAVIGKAGAVWPYRMVTGIFEALLEQYQDRYALEANTPALGIYRNSTSEYAYSVVTARGIIQTKHVVHCTEGHTAHLLPMLRGILVPRRGQMTVQNPGSAFPQRGDCSWNFYLDNMDYATQNPSTGELFLGGGDVVGYGPALGNPSDAEEAVSALSHLGGLLPAAFGHETWGTELPGKPRVKASWTGILCNSLDKVPLVGMLPQEALDRPAGSRDSGEWISAGYGGYGMVNAFLCGKAVAMMMLGKDDSYWLPNEYRLTTTRLHSLYHKLGQVVASEERHLKALL
ncbi:hypothetical protein LTR84_005783 [Exophiala bonariae]|uniref:FAD dependent oxidoreductase domain-containing protein n=1 Tax=Exophiala bonariae TaxID=1690606 RepID=A0AAV9N394_9EURO|nr:hypothetical protein LTR84_005783 [Exophiala bonariae]